MKKTLTICILLLSVTLLSFKAKTSALFQVPKGWPKPAYDLNKNPLTERKITLGRLLFYDAILSKDSSISCASCHSSFNAFTHVDHDLSHGIAGKIGNRNSPALMNLAWSTGFMWDGAVNHLDVQALAPIANPLEMDETITHVTEKLQALDHYKRLFKAAYGDTVVTGERVLKSLSQFMLTLVSCNAKYDSVQRGERKFTAAEQRGYALFKTNCASCHTEPLFTNQQYENNGLFVDETLNDAGRMKITHRADDSLKFKVPTLRNIQYTYPYMHDGRFKNLNQVINNYIRGVQHTPTLSAKLQKGIYMSNDEKMDLIAFLLTLSDKNFITNPAYAFPEIVLKDPKEL